MNDSIYIYILYIYIENIGQNAFFNKKALKTKYIYIYIYNAYFKKYEHQKTTKYETSWKPLNKSRNNNGKMQENHEKVYENHAIINENERKPCKHQQNTMQRGIATSETDENHYKIKKDSKVSGGALERLMKSARLGKWLQPQRGNPKATKTGGTQRGVCKGIHKCWAHICTGLVFLNIFKFILESFFLNLLLFIFGCKQF